ncbi:F-box only protein 9 [Chytridiales sp. JEL 0842]|nr:F-box only protein 9 [Chytridiales sp. JEL 0842]
MDLEEFRQNWKSELLQRQQGAHQQQQQQQQTSITSKAQGPIQQSTTIASFPEAPIVVPAVSTTKPQAAPQTALQPFIEDELVESFDANVAIVAETSPHKMRNQVAVRLYHAACDMEESGNIKDAVLKFREAEKLAPNVHTLVQDDLRVQKEIERLKAIPPAEAPLNRQRSYARRGKPLFSSLPEEVIIQVIKWCLIIDMNSLISLSSVSQSFDALTKHRTIYKELCRSFLRPERSFTTLQEELVLYGGDWFNMWLDKPRIRFDGVYISKVNYIRSGYVDSFHNSFLVVTYYRYLRFFPDQSLISWTTTVEPAQGVKTIVPEAKMKGMALGSYKVNGHEVLITTKDPSSKRNTFYLTLKLASSKRGKNNKLSWVDYFHIRDDDESTKAEITSNQLKPFIFARVKSFPNYMFPI